MNNESSRTTMQTDSEYESDVSSINDNASNLNDEHLVKRIDSLAQENLVLQIELQTYKLRLKASQQEIKRLKSSSINIQVKAEQEEEFISNKLFKKIKELKKEKETLANNYEREEEFITNDLSRKLQKIRDEKNCLEKSLEHEQSAQIKHLIRRIQRLEAEVVNKENTLEQLKTEKIELENTLEKEQEYLVNRLWKRMDKLETDKKLLQCQVHQSHSQTTNSNSSSSIDLNSDARPNHSTTSLVGSHSMEDDATSYGDCALQLKEELEKLREELNQQKETHKRQIEEILLEEQNVKEENLRLQRKLQIEVDRRQEFYRKLSESESSIEMDEERALNQKIKFHSRQEQQRTSSPSPSPYSLARSRTASSPAFIINQNFEHLQRRRLTSNSIETNFHTE